MKRKMSLPAWHQSKRVTMERRTDSEKVAVASDMMGHGHRERADDSEDGDVDRDSGDGVHGSSENRRVKAVKTEG